jgi:hypothetical protein
LGDDGASDRPGGSVPRHRRGLEEGRVTHGLREFVETFESNDLEAWEERRLEAEQYLDAGDVVVFLHEYRRGRGSG